ncbi:MAG: bifunctional phosphopantothenoylcysteine decarboxylase/phosphopantothenate--cysteine ligase CoaBC [Pseudobdellovibrio sp.]
MLKSKKILFILTGSIACYKACNVISKLKQNGYELKIVLSPSSLEFIGKATIEGLTGEEAITDMYSSGHVMDHINLARWADLVLVAPATANYINKIASGIGDDLLTTLFLAHDFTKPFLIAPAMNTKMYQHPVTQDSITKLKKMGVDILETASGVLACGEIGSGRLLEPELIYNEVARHFNDKSDTAKSQGLKVLITSGGTSEPIDDIRVITNKSTGRTAAFIAQNLIESGIDVTYLHSPQAVLPAFQSNNKVYSSYADLEKLLQTELTQNRYDFVIQAAAVSDYSVEKSNGKISSDADELTLKLKKNPKLINLIKKLSPSAKLVGFKLTSQADEATIVKKVTSLFENAHCDYVVQNDWQKVSGGNPQYRFYSKNKLTDFKTIDSLESLSAVLFQTLTQRQA